ncbi:hypothetical protein [Bradyrhizobium pachyrhizi]|uniref:hypothetical protein n=1 Tax=Bradyrhizobium pachyrhizi TaxID=280333 RepID=UPI003D323A20
MHWGYACLVASLRGPLQELVRLNLELVGKTTYYLYADVVRALFKLAQIAPAYLGLEGKLVLRPSPRIAQAAQIGGEYFPQVHAGKDAACSIYDTSIYLTKCHLMHVVNGNCSNLVRMRKVIRTPPLDRR